ncbi:MAG TPA: ABC transporter permease [Mycobacteriales bacterium]|nr:ABC transporter permease [Mycobacteriales bacterium]
MFFITYLQRELRRRLRQSSVIALGLALGVGLVITVIAASSGVKKAQAGVLHSLYGVGTDVTVTKNPSRPKPGAGNGFKIGPQGSQVCKAGKCSNAPAGASYDNLSSPTYAPQDASAVSDVAKLDGVKTAVGGLVLNDTKITIPSSVGNGKGLQPPKTFTVDGVDIAHSNMGPISSATVSKGRALKTSDADSNVAVVDANYASTNDLEVGSTITIAGKKFTIVGLAEQPQASSPPNVYIPLARAQALATGPSGTSLKGQVNTIYVSASSATAISAVQKEISKLLPSATVTTSSSLADQVTGSLASTAKLANELGRWLSILVLIAAFAVASLLTMAAVSRRVREFGTLKAIGWRSRRIIGQVMGESVATGLFGAAGGIGLGYLGTTLITTVAPKLSASVQTATGMRMQSIGPGGSQNSTPTIDHTVSIPMSASVSLGAVVLAVVLAIAGGVIAGSFGSWRIAGLRPAAALSRVA